MPKPTTDSSGNYTFPSDANSFRRLVRLDLDGHAGTAQSIDKRAQVLSAVTGHVGWGPLRGGVVGADMVAKAAPDGHTMLLAGSGSFVISSLVQPRLPYDPVAGFASIAYLVGGQEAPDQRAEYDSRMLGGFVSLLLHDASRREEMLAIAEKAHRELDWQAKLTIVDMCRDSWAWV